HETKKHPHNRVVPHSFDFELPSNLKQFTLHCPKNLFYYVFHQELGFEYQPAQQKYKLGSEVKVMTEKKDPETKQMVEVEFKFFWEEQTGKEECNEKIYTWTYGLVKLIFEICKQNLSVLYEHISYAMGFEESPPPIV
ncbi:3889_t:CDS:2, partial [Gigaspora margarita]